MSNTGVKISKTIHIVSRKQGDFNTPILSSSAIHTSDWSRQGGSRDKTSVAKCYGLATGGSASYLCVVVNTNANNQTARMMIDVK